MDDGNKQPFTVGIDSRALDGSFRAHAVRGIGRYAKELTTALTNKALNGICVQNVVISYPQWTRFIPKGRDLVCQSGILPLLLNRIAEQNNIDAFHFLAQTDPPPYCSVPYILSVHDIIPILFDKEGLNAGDRIREKVVRSLLVRGITNAYRIIASSGSTADDLVNVLGIPSDRIDIVPLGISDAFFKNRDEIDLKEWKIKQGIDRYEKLILYVGGIDRHKNLGYLFDIASRLRDRLKTRIGVVLVGKVEGHEMYHGLRAKCKSAGIEDMVHWAGFVSDEDLLRYYLCADVFVFPSLYEGFGFPPLEAMAGGTPVVYVENKCMNEMLGDGACKVRADDSAGAADLVYKILYDRSLWLEFSERGKKRARMYTWDKTVQLTLKVYESVHRDIKRLDDEKTLYARS